MNPRMCIGSKGQASRFLKSSLACAPQ